MIRNEMATRTEVVDSIEDAMRVLKGYERETASKFVVFTSPKDFGNSAVDLRGRRVYWHDSSIYNRIGSMVEENGCYSPYIILERKVYNCHHGMDKSISTKKKAKRKADAKQARQHRKI